MQQSIERMAGQLQSMSQEVRQLTQLAQQLAQQNMTHYQQMQPMTQNNRAMYSIAGNEQSSGHLLQIISQVCGEMNHHLRTISQHLSTNAAAMQAGQAPMYQGTSSRTFTVGGGMQTQQSIAPEGPIATDTTHIAHNYVPGMQQTRRMTSMTDDNNQLHPGGGQSLTAGGQQDAQTSMTAGTQGAQMGGKSTQGQTVGSQPQMGGTQQQLGGTQQQMSGTQGQMRGSQQQLGGTAQQMNTSARIGGGTSAQSQMNQSSQMSSTAQQQQSGTEADLKNNTQEYREEPHNQTYPYNRYTT